MLRRCVDCGKSTGGVLQESLPGMPEYCVTCLTKHETKHMLAMLPGDETDTEWDRLTEKEQMFLYDNDCGSFRYKFGLNGRVTEKQFQWLEYIYLRLK